MHIATSTTDSFPAADRAGSTLPGSGAAAERTPLLRRVLQLDAVSCAGTGLVLAVGASPVADLLDVGQVGLLRGIGIFLVLYAAGLLAASRATPVTMRRWARRSVEADGAWVLGSAALIVLGTFSAVGALLAAAAALVVGTLAVAKLRLTA